MVQNKTKQDCKKRYSSWDKHVSHKEHKWECMAFHNNVIVIYLGLQLNQTTKLLLAA